MVESCVKILAKCSYEIFLLQMLVISIYPNALVTFFLDEIGLDTTVYRVLFRILFVSFISILLGYMFNKFYHRAVKTYSK